MKSVRFSLRLIFGLLSIVVGAAAAKVEDSAQQWSAPQLSGEVGFRGGAGSEARLSTWGRSYIEPAVNWRPRRDSGFEFKLQGRSWLQSELQSGAQESRWGLEVRDSYISYDSDSSRTRIGFQQLSWGETFGFFIADLPNPRDLSDPLLLEIGHIKKPVFMLQQQWFFDRGAIQVFFTPIARQMEFPIALARREFNHVGNDSEFGIKANHLFDFGLDGSVFFLKHKDRSFVVDPQSVWSMGATATQSVGRDWILRSDQVFSKEWRGALALDWNATQNLMISLQGQRDPLNSGASVRMMLRSFEGLLENWEFEAFWFQGIEKNELWLQPKLTYRSRGGLSISGRYDWVEAAFLQPGLLSSVAREDRGLIWLSYGF